MRVSGRQLCRSASRAVTMQKPSESGIAARKNTPGQVGLHRTTAAAMANDVNSAAGKIFSGSSSGASYAPDGGILGQTLNPRAAAVAAERDRQVEETKIFAEPARAEAAPPPAPLSLAELKQLPVAELNQMCKVRGVRTLGAGADKDDLAKWVQQHQDLPEQCPAPPAQAARTQVPVKSLSVKELKKKSVRELNEMLEVRGVGKGTATDKDELAKWVWQHSDLPVVRKSERERKEGRWTWGFGTGNSGPYDSPRDHNCNHKPPPDQEQLEGEKPELLEEGKQDPQKLLEGGEETEKEEKASPLSKIWLIPAGIGLALVTIIGALAYRDSSRQRQETEEHEREQ